MAKIYFSFFILIFSVFQAQIVNIPDANLKAKLLAANTTNNIAQDNNFNNIKIDTNSNNEIELSEALTVYNLFLSSSQNQGVNLISNISGLTSFSNLKYLNLDNNNLTSLDATPFTKLQKLHISYNPLSSLNVNNLLNLKLLWCRSLLNFTTLDISNLPSLEDFRCNGNQLASLNLSNKPNLVSLDCSNNNIASLNLSSLSNLEYLYINNNPLTFIDLSSQSKINTLNSMYTNIQTINVMGQFNLQTLMVGNTPTLEYVFMKNGSYETGTNFEYLPNLKYVCVDVNNTLENYNMTYLSNLPGNNFVVNSYCNFSPGGVTNLIAGNTKYDSNNNGCDANDLNSAYQKFQISGYGGNGSIIANNSGNYSIPVQAGTHTITPILENPAYFTISPASFTANFPSMTSPLTQNFCLTANGNHNDLEVLIIPITAAAPGFNAKYKIIYKNKGTASQSGTLVFNFNDNLMNFLTSTLAPNAQTTGVLNWNFTNLLPFESRELTVTFTLNTPTQNPPLLGGNILNYSAQINGATDETPADNLFTLNQTVVNSFDPNDKTCLEGSTIAPTQVGTYVHYLIRFENTGTANAQNIVVKDDIDLSKFDLATLVPLNASHNFVTRISGSNTVEFIFENIQLPFLDATNDGFVAFKIKTKSNLVLGNTFSNTAKIYFDYNAPIITNTYATTVQNFLATAEVSKDDTSVKIFPNPVNDVLQIKSKEKVIKAEIYDVSGRILKSESLQTETINVADLPKGNYLLKIFTKDKISTQKFIKQ